MRFPLILILLLSVSTTGCTLTNAVKETFAMFRPSSDDGWDPTENPDPQWDSVGIEARGGQALEYENDPSRKWLMSNKARSIERNLGIGD
jgi:hypothetical protein